MNASARNAVKARAALTAQAADRLEEYAYFRETSGASLKKAAEWLGVSVRTAYRYEAAMKEGAAA